MSEYIYSPKLSQYRDRKTGKIISKAKILELLDSEKARLETRLVRLSSQLESGDLSIAAWQKQITQELKQSHIRMGLLAGGGTNVPYNRKLYGAIGNNLKKQQEFLVQFRRDIQKGKYKDNPLKLKWRAKLYADSIRESFNDGERIARNAEGFDLAKRVLDAGARHCDDCLRYRSRGWVKVSEVVLPGQLCACAWRCRCSISYKRSYTPVWETQNLSPLS